MKKLFTSPVGVHALACRVGVHALACVFTALLLLTSFTAHAHEVTEANTKGLFGFSPEYVHVLLNPLPAYGLIAGIFVLLAGLVIRSVATRNVGLIVILICTGITWVVLHYGQHAYNDLYDHLDPEAQKWANIHMDRAESFAWVLYVTAVLSIIALVVPKYSTEVVRPTTTPSPAPTTPTPTTTPPPQTQPAKPIIRKTRSPIGTISASIVLLSAIISFAIGCWISRAGGRIRHPEFREPMTLATPAAAEGQTNAPADHHHH